MGLMDGWVENVKRRRATSAPRFLFRFSVLSILLGVMFLGGYLQWRTVYAEAALEPQEMTLQELCTRGYGKNRHVRVRDFQFVKPYVVVPRKASKPDEYDYVLLPVVPAGAAAAPAQVPVLVRTFKPKSPADVDRYLQETRVVQGMVLNGFKPPTPRELDLLRQTYPQTDWSRCIFLQQGEGPPTLVESLIAIGVGLGALMLGVGLLLLYYFAARGQAAAAVREQRRYRVRLVEEDEP